MKDLRREKKKNILLIQETKVKSKKIKKLATKIWNKVNYGAIPTIGKLMDLLIMWEPLKVEAVIITYPSNTSLSMEIKYKATNFNFVISNIYAPNIIARRKIFYNMFSNHLNLF